MASHLLSYLDTDVVKDSTADEYLALSKKIHKLVSNQYQIFNRQLLPDLMKVKLKIANEKQRTKPKQLGCVTCLLIAFSRCSFPWSWTHRIHSHKCRAKRSTTSYVYQERMYLDDAMKLQSYKFQECFPVFLRSLREKGSNNGRIRRSPVSFANTCHSYSPATTFKN